MVAVFISPQAHTFTTARVDTYCMSVISDADLVVGQPPINRKLAHVTHSFVAHVKENANDPSGDCHTFSLLARN